MCWMYLFNTLCREGAPTFLMLGILAFFILKVTFRLIGFYCLAIMIFYQIVYLVGHKQGTKALNEIFASISPNVSYSRCDSGVTLVANDILLINTIVAVLVVSYVHEYYLRWDSSFLFQTHSDDSHADHSHLWRKTFLKKETFLFEHKKLLEEKENYKEVLKNVLPLPVIEPFAKSRESNTLAIGITSDSIPFTTCYRG
jgi:hypothetical protein